MRRFSIIGVGTAGRARAKAIEAHPYSELVAVYRGRYAADVGAPEVASIDEAIARADVVAVCSPNDQHADHVRLALEAGKHVVVEYPLATTATVGAELFEIARKRGLVLHVEHIELLGAVARALRAHVAPQNVISAEVTFDRPGPEGVPGRRLPAMNHARLHRIVDCCGPIASIERVRVEPGTFLADMTLDCGARLGARFLQGPELSRHTRLDIRTASGHWQQLDRELLRDDESMTLIQSGRLFSVDHDWLMKRLETGLRPYVSDDRVLHVLDVVDALIEGNVPRMIAPR